MPSASPLVDRRGGALIGTAPGNQRGGTDGDRVRAVRERAVLLCGAPNVCACVYTHVSLLSGARRKFPRVGPAGNIAERCCSTFYRRPFSTLALYGSPRRQRGAEAGGKMGLWPRARRARPTRKAGRALLSALARTKTHGRRCRGGGTGPFASAGSRLVLLDAGSSCNAHAVGDSWHCRGRCNVLLVERVRGLGHFQKGVRALAESCVALGVCMPMTL